MHISYAPDIRLCEYKRIECIGDEIIIAMIERQSSGSAHEMSKTYAVCIASAVLISCNVLYTTLGQGKYRSCTVFDAHSRDDLSDWL